ncbi:AraC family transcriptional regulator [Aquimarina sp. AU58]|uniref:helix-turn-helix domain-containing protein n=1 Tax=Aquimarina sp. AU58 TaxID=1874112 RepID=UPI000D6E85E4
MLINKTSYKPNKSLATYVDRIYVLKHSGAFKLPAILPGTGLELLFHTHEPLLINNHKCDNGHIICPRNSILHIDEFSDVSFISVRFKSGAFRHFSSIPFIELNNQFASVEDIWGVKGKDFLEKLNEHHTINDKIKCIESFLLKCLYDYHNKQNDKWDTIMHSLYKQYNSISLKELATYTNLSYRQFERNFKSQFGITPKKIQRIIRFEATVKKILLNRNPGYLSTALDHGYYDQSHFINEFQFFTEEKPSNYFVTKNYDHHFYDKSIKAPERY